MMILPLKASCKEKYPVTSTSFSVGQGLSINAAQPEMHPMHSNSCSKRLTKHVLVKEVTSAVCQWLEQQPVAAICESDVQKIIS